MTKIVLSERDKILRSVLTPQEASRKYCISSSAIRYACLDGRLKARKSGATWLIWEPDILELWGDKLK